MNRPRKTNKHLPRNVYHKHGAYWFVRNGKWHRLGADLKASLSVYASLYEGPTGAMPTLIDKVLDHVKPKLSANTVKQYAASARYLKRALVEFEPHEVKSRDIAAIKVALSGKPNWGNRCLSVLRVVFAHAVEWQLVDSNPCIGILRHAEHKRTRYLTDEELAAIRAHAVPRLQVVIDLLYYTGQRISDVLALRRADITPEGVRFVQAKTGAKLTVAMSSELEAAIGRAKALHGNIVALTLLHNRRGKPPGYNTVKGQWARAIRAAGIQDARIHDIRAKSLTDAKRQGKDATALAGHANASMTARYIRLRESPVVEGPSVLDVSRR